MVEPQTFVMDPSYAADAASPSPSDFPGESTVWNDQLPHPVDTAQVLVYLPDPPRRLSLIPVVVDSNGQGFTINERAMIPDVSYYFTFKGEAMAAVKERDDGAVVVYRLLEETDATAAHA